METPYSCYSEHRYAARRRLPMERTRVRACVAGHRNRTRIRADDADDHRIPTIPNRPTPAGIRHRLDSNADWRGLSCSVSTLCEGVIREDPRPNPNEHPPPQARYGPPSLDCDVNPLHPRISASPLIGPSGRHELQARRTDEFRFVLWERAKRVEEFPKGWTAAVVASSLRPSEDSSTCSRTRSLRMTGIGCSVIPGVGAATRRAGAQSDRRGRALPFEHRGVRAPTMDAS